MRLARVMAGGRTAALTQSRPWWRRGWHGQFRSRSQHILPGPPLGYARNSLGCAAGLDNQNDLLHPAGCRALLRILFLFRGSDSVTEFAGFIRIKGRSQCVRHGCGGLQISHEHFTPRESLDQIPMRTRSQEPRSQSQEEGKPPHTPRAQDGCPSITRLNVFLGWGSGVEPMPELFRPISSSGNAGTARNQSSL